MTCGLSFTPTLIQYNYRSWKSTLYEIQIFEKTDLFILRKSLAIRRSEDLANDEMGIDAWNLDWIERIRKRTKLNRKEDVLDVFVQNQKNLARIQLDPSDVDTEQAFRDAIREDVTLNRIKFIGENRMSAFVAAVKQIASQ